MFEREIERYNTLLKEYRATVIDKFNVEDLKEYNEILFSAHSCAIEGNTFSVDDTRALKEEGLGMIPQGKTLFEAFEILDHFNAYEFLMEQTDRPLTEQLVKETHRILTQHTLTYRYKDAVPGEYTNTDMGAGDTIFGDHEKLIARVPKLMEATQKAIEELPVHPVEIAAQFHKHFIFLHPFRDGNGRLGRLLSNFILVKLGHPMILIEKQDRDKYIGAIKRMETEIVVKKEMTKDNDYDYSI